MCCIISAKETERWTKCSFLSTTESGWSHIHPPSLTHREEHSKQNEATYPVLRHIMQATSSLRPAQWTIQNQDNRIVLIQPLQWFLLTFTLLPRNMMNLPAWNRSCGEANQASQSWQNLDKNHQPIRNILSSQWTFTVIKAQTKSMQWSILFPKCLNFPLPKSWPKEWHLCNFELLAHWHTNCPPNTQHAHA